MKTSENSFILTLKWCFIYYLFVATYSRRDFWRDFLSFFKFKKMLVEGHMNSNNFNWLLSKY